MPPKKKVKADDPAPASDLFKDLVFFVNGTFTKSQDEIKALIEENSGTTARSLTAKVTHLVTVDGGAKIEDAKAKNIKVVSEQFLHDSISKKAKQDEAGYAIESKKRAADAGSDKADDEPAKKKRGRKNDAVAATPAPAAASATPAPAPAAPAADEEKKVKVLKRGRAPVDPNARLNPASHHVLEEGDTVWDCMLNQTNIGNNNNKFYVIQLIASDDGKQFYCYNRWGRVGERGQDKNEPFGGHLDGAKNAFRKKFKDKAANNWEDRHKFVPKAGKYTLIEIDYGNDKEEEKKPAKRDVSPAKEKKLVESKLDPRVQELIRMIFDMKMMENTLVEMEFDIKKSPLGKLTKKQIKDGYGVLQQMEKAINGTEKGDLEDLANRFYTLIPHNFGRNRPTIIRSIEQIKSKMQMLDALAEIEIATKILEESANGSDLVAQLDQHYQKLKCAIVPIEQNTEEFKRIAKFVETNQENKGYGGRLELLELFKVARDGESARFKKEVGNRKMLWHGSRLTNFAGILSQGLRIAPPEAPASGYRFGKGLYFADIMTLSSNYCRVTAQSPVGLMLLCDTALGKQYECPRDKYMDKPPPNYDSTWALGTVEPDPKGDIKLSDGCVLPAGPIVPSKHKAQDVSCHEHQLIVYQESLAEMKYLLKLKWHFK